MTPGRLIGRKTVTAVRGSASSRRCGGFLNSAAQRGSIRVRGGAHRLDQNRPFRARGPRRGNLGVCAAMPRGSSSSICLLICSFVRRLFILINLFLPPVSRSQEETFLFLPPSKLKPQHIFFYSVPSFIAHARARSLTRLSVVVVETAALPLPPPAPPPLPVFLLTLSASTQLGQERRCSHVARA